MLIIMIDLISIVGIIINLAGIYQFRTSVFLIGRVICGIAVGFNGTLVPIYIKEISPDALTQRT